MKTTDQNRINMVTATASVINKYNEVWKDHEAFAQGVADLDEKLSQIDGQIQITQGNPGASKVKETALQDLRTSVCEVIGAVRSYAARNSNPQLLAKVDYSPSEIVAGKASEVVARCKTIHTAATGIVAELGKYGITAAKLAALKKKIDGFDGVKVAPRESVVEKRSARQLLPQLVRDAIGILRDQLDGLMLQFKDNANFYEEYLAARSVVDHRVGRTEEDTTAGPATATAPLAKAA
jgi:hypothetical protein